MEELERQKEKYDALEKTWMAANQQFMEFQVSSWKMNPNLETRIYFEVSLITWKHHFRL